MMRADHKEIADVSKISAGLNAARHLHDVSARKRMDNCQGTMVAEQPDDGRAGKTDQSTDASQKTIVSICCTQRTHVLKLFVYIYWCCQQEWLL